MPRAPDLDRLNFNPVERLESLLAMLRPAPDEWLIQPKTQSSELLPAPCKSYTKLVEAWRAALRWDDGLDCALAVMLASSASTMLVGEQLWFKILGPPSSGKTTLLEGLAVDREHVISKDSIRGFYQGWRDKRGSDEDLSVAALARGKTLATKDGDTLLKAPNLQQILSEARGLYDRVGRTHYRNAIMRDYEGHRMTWLLCGTLALREIDESELGSRFLDCVVMDSIDDDFENDVAWQAANEEADCMRRESNGRADGQHPRNLARAMRLTGGYLHYLRDNVVRLMSNVELSEARRGQCVGLGKFVAHMRARPSSSSDEAEASREFSARLVKQHVRLAKMLSVVLNRREADEEVMRRVRRVSTDTARGKPLEIVNALRRTPDGMESGSLSTKLALPQAKTSKALRFMRDIGVVRNVTLKGRRNRVRWMLTKKMVEMCREVESI